MTAPEPTIADVYANLATELDEGEHPGITLHDLMAAIRETAPGVFAEAARDAGFIPGAPELDTTPVTRGELAAAALAAERAQETIAMLGEDLIRQRKRAERAEAALRGAQPDAAGTAGAGEGKGTPEPPTGALSTGERDLIHSDLGELLELLGLGNYARPESPHEVFRQCLAVVATVKAERDHAAGLSLKLGLVRELAGSWAERAPAARTVAEDFTMSPLDTVSADCGRCILGILDGDREPAEPQPDTAGFLGLNGGNLVRWSGATAPGGYVCAVPVPGNPDNICGIPVESEPCSEHRDPAWRPE